LTFFERCLSLENGAFEIGGDELVCYLARIANDSSDFIVAFAQIQGDAFYIRHYFRELSTL